MAVDSQAKRMSCIGLGLAVPSLLPVADSSVSAPDRLHLCWLYSGIAAAAAVVADYLFDGDVAVRLTADGNVALRLTADGNAAIRLTADGDIEL